MSTRIKVNKFKFDVTERAFEDELESGGFEADSDIRVLSFSTFDELLLEDEIHGKTAHLQDIATLSLIQKCIVFCGITTSVQGVRNMSVAVFHRGTLVDIVDRTIIANDGYSGSDKIKIFSTDFGRIGLLIDRDVLLYSNWQKTAPNCDCILCIAKEDDPDFSSAVLLLSTQFSVPFLLVSASGINWHESEEL